MNKYTKKVQCPGCAAEGRDNSGNNLNLFENNPNKGWCYSCSKVYTAGTAEHSQIASEGAYVTESIYTKQMLLQQHQQLDISAIQALPYRALEHKPISKEICEKFGVKATVSEVTGKIDKVYYPYFDPDDFSIVTGYKVRVVATKKFYTIGEKKSLFGQNVCKSNAMLLIITEGEDDTLSCAQMQKDLGKDYNVVSVPNGANKSATVDTVVRSQLEFIVGHKNVIPFLDWDIPGRLASKTLADFLCSQTTVKLVTNSYKDAGEYLKAGKTQKYLQDLFAAKEYHPTAIIKGSDIDIEKVMEEDSPGFKTPYPLLNDKLLGLRPGEITLVVAGTGIGKSSVVREMAYHLVINHNQKIANILLETQDKDASKGYIAIDNNIPLWKLKRNRHEITPQQLQTSKQKLFDSDQMNFLKHHGSIHPDKLIEYCNYFVKVVGCKWIILDHISMVFSGHDSDNERKDIDKLMTRLAEFVNQTGAGVLAVVHLKRVQGKSFNKGDEVELTDLRGSASLEQIAFNVIAVERNMQGDSRDISKLRVLKNRVAGHTGLCDHIRYDHPTGRLPAYDMQYG